jgi:hypothetical protein
MKHNLEEFSTIKAKDARGWELNFRPHFEYFKLHGSGFSHSFPIQVGKKTITKDDKTINIQWQDGTIKSYQIQWEPISAYDGSCTYHGQEMPFIRIKYCGTTLKVRLCDLKKHKARIL